MLKRQELDQMRERSKQDLLKDIADVQKELVELKLSRQQAKTSNVHVINRARRKLAQLMTLAAMKETA